MIDRAIREAGGVTPDRLRELLDYDSGSGVFRWRSSRGRARVGAVAGRRETSRYIEIGIDGRLRHAHRLAWIYVHGSITAGHVIDHINGAVADNRLSNLRAVSVSENGQNRHRPAGANPAVGVTWDKARQLWRADIKIGDKKFTIGRFDRLDTAIAVHRDEKAKHHGIWPELVSAEGAPPAPAAPAAEQQEAA